MNGPMATLFDQFIKERIYLKAVTPKTRLWYEAAFKRFQGTPGEGFSKARVQAFVVMLRDAGVRPRSVNTYLQALNAFGVWLHQEHGEDRVHQKLLQTEKRVLVTLTEKELRTLLAFKPQTFPQWRSYALVSTILDTGGRIEELLIAKELDFDFENPLVTVYGKGRKERKIPFSFELRKLLFRYVQFKHKHGVSDYLMFPTRDGTKWSQRTALRSHYILLQKVGLPMSGFHRLRHTFATQYLKAGGDVVRLSKLLGHSQITTTQKYEHLLTEDLQAPCQRLSILSRLRR
jgi:integrase/recombinase XerD